MSKPAARARRGGQRVSWDSGRHALASPAFGGGALTARLASGHLDSRCSGRVPALPYPPADGGRVYRATRGVRGAYTTSCGVPAGRGLHFVA